MPLAESDGDNNHQIELLPPMYYTCIIAIKMNQIWFRPQNDAWMLVDAIPMLLARFQPFSFTLKHNINLHH